MSRYKNGIFAILVLALMAFAPYHHGWSNYDQDKVLDYTGTVEEFVFENPHATAKLKDKEKTWLVILAPTSRMDARGVPKDKITKGSSLRVTGYPHKTIKDEMRAERIYVDGEKFGALVVDSFTELLLWLENSSWATSIKKSLWLYPFIEIIHIIGILFVAGAAILFDFRLLGLSKRGTVVDAAKNLLPWSLRGLIVAIPSGILLFITNAETLANDITFQLKLSLLALAGVNALLFRSVVYKHWLRNGSEPIKLPLLAKLNGVISIVLWFSIIACGRLLAY